MLLLPAGYEAGRLSRCSGLSRSGGGGRVRSDEAQDALLNAVRQLGDVLRNRIAPILQAADGLLQLTPTMAQFALDADTGFADLALEPVASRVAAALEAA